MVIRHFLPGVGRLLRGLQSRKEDFSAGANDPISGFCGLAARSATGSRIRAAAKKYNIKIGEKSGPPSVEKKAFVRWSKAKHQAPKAWWDKMKKKIKKNNKKYSDERVNETVGEIWYNRLSDKKRKEIYKRHGKTKSPNK